MKSGTWELVREARDDRFAFSHPRSIFRRLSCGFLTVNQQLLQMNSWPDNVYFRVHTVYNKHTKLYILWVNLNGGKADYGKGTQATCRCLCTPNTR